MRYRAAACLVLTVIAGCGSTTSASTYIEGFLNQALAHWQQFPADGDPRPIVRLVGITPDLPGTFTNQDAETAFYCHKFTGDTAEFASDTPAEAHVTWAFGTRISYAAVSALAAFRELSSAAGRASRAECQRVSPLVLTSARLGAAEFETDRGPAEMTAYLFAMTGASGELAYPAVGPSAFWKGAGGVVYGEGYAEVSLDGMSMTWAFVGAPPGHGHCQTEYKALVVESGTAVAIAAVETPQLPLDCVVAPLTSESVWRTLTISLKRPLGGRVVVDESAGPVPVCPINQPTGPPC